MKSRIIIALLADCLRFLIRGSKLILVPLFLSLCGAFMTSCSPHVDGTLIVSKTNGNGAGPSDAGIWYCTYYNTLTWDHLLDNNPSYRLAKNYYPLCSDTPNDFRHYLSNDIKIIDFHLHKLAEAQIDFVLFELTPAGLGAYAESQDYKDAVDAAKTVCGRINEWNKNNLWKIRYAVAAGLQERLSDSYGLAIAKVAEDAYKTFYNNPQCGGPANYYQLDGKPLLVCYSTWRPQDTDPTWNQEILNREWSAYQGDKTYGNDFTLRTSRPYADAGQYGWPLPLGHVTSPNSEVELVVPGFNSHGDIQLRRQGTYYKACWEKVLANKKPQIVMIQAFNDYCEDSAVWTTDTRWLDATEEKWFAAGSLPPGMQFIPSSPSPKLSPTMYWDMTTQYIRLLRRSGSQ